jgi:hypothetical protein
VKPPFSPAILLKSYRVDRITGDKYAGEFPRELFRRRGIKYLLCDKPKSDLYRDLLPGLNSGRIVLPRSEQLTNQLIGLERRTTRAGKDSIDHGPGGHDDIANAVAGAFDAIAGRRPIPYPVLASWDGTSAWWPDDEINSVEWAAAARNVELGSAPSTIAKGSDIPNDFVLRVTGLAP